MRKPKARSLEITRMHLERGQGVARMIWIKASPRHPLLKTAALPPIVAIMVILLAIFLLILSLSLLTALILGIKAERQGKGGASDRLSN